MPTPRPTVCALLLASLIAPQALAQEPHVRLEVERGPHAERCPSDEVLRELVVARLGRDPFDDASPIVLRATLARDGRIWRARIERFEADGAPSGSRELTVPGRECDELAEALTLAIGIAVDPVLLGASASPADETDETDEAEPPPAEPAAVEVEPPRAARPIAPAPPSAPRAPASAAPTASLRLAARVGIAALPR